MVNALILLLCNMVPFSYIHVSWLKFRPYVYPFGTRQNEKNMMGNRELLESTFVSFEKSRVTEIKSISS